MILTHEPADAASVASVCPSQTMPRPYGVSGETALSVDEMTVCQTETQGIVVTQDVKRSGKIQDGAETAFQSVAQLSRKNSRRGGTADAEDLKSSEGEPSCGFDSHRRH